MRMTKVRMRMARQSSIRKHLRNFCSIAVASIVILCVGNRLVDAAYNYTTTNNRGFDTDRSDDDYQVTVGATPAGVTTWQQCETECRNHAECQLFALEGYIHNYDVDPGCYLYRIRLGYGSLWYHNRITGQLESTAANAPLSWLGIGMVNALLIGPVLDTSPTMITHAMCQAHCDTAVTEDNVTCGQYKIDMYKCFISSNIITDLPTGSLTESIGVRDGLPKDGLTVQNDPLNTRVAVAEFPPAPPDIGTAIPAYTEINFHYANGLDLFFPFATIPVANVSWEDCAVECHRNSKCLSFLAKIVIALSYKVTECQLYDLAIFGRVSPDFSKYGVIDRSGAEGDVLSLVDSDSHLSGYLYLAVPNVTSMDDCAKRCYDFYRPKLCIGFYLNTISELCHFYESIPCLPHKNATDSLYYYDEVEYDYDVWEAAESRFGYIPERVSADTRTRVNSNCLVDPTTTTSTTTSTTTATVGQNLHRGPGAQIFSINGGKSIQGVAARETLLKQTRLRCIMACHIHIWCVSYDWNEATNACRLFEMAVNAGKTGANASTTYGVSSGFH